MSYQSKNLSVIAYANGFTFWHYMSEDKATEVSAPDYFNEAGDMLRVGDVLLSNLSVGEVEPETRFFSVQRVNSGEVEVKDMYSGS